MIALLATIGISFFVLLGVIAGMAIGVMRGRAPISGSCGGISNGRCALCSGDCKKESKR